MLPPLSDAKLFQHSGTLTGTFFRLGCEGEILFDTDQVLSARDLLLTALQEITRIETAFSRYRTNSIVHWINTHPGQPVRVDEETAKLIDFAAHAYQLSDGLFDITSGVLRKAWSFKGSRALPTQQEIDSLLPLVGWEKIQWANPVITLRPGMEIDLGGIGKEYAVDRVLFLLQQQSNIGMLVNLGGDVAAGGQRRDQGAWTVGIESIHAANQARHLIQIKQGALATSGDTKRFLQANGQRYGHILNPRTGWPVVGAPSSITVAADTCSEAGLLSTVAMLKGERAEAFLKESGARYWCTRS